MVNACLSTNYYSMLSFHLIFFTQIVCLLFVVVVFCHI